jgi:hypothetical protein
MPAFGEYLESLHFKDANFSWQSPVFSNHQLNGTASAEFVVIWCFCAWYVQF